jgi:hypothetical protein
VLYPNQTLKSCPQPVENIRQSGIPQHGLSILPAYPGLGNRHTVAVIQTASASNEEQKFEAKTLASSVDLVRAAISGCCLELVESHGPQKLSLVGRPSMT